MSPGNAPTGRPVRVVVNGEEREVPPGTTAADLLRILGIPPAVAVVERNGTVLERARLEAVLLEDGDRLELVRFVGGG